MARHLLYFTIFAFCFFFLLLLCCLTFKPSYLLFECLCQSKSLNFRFSLQRYLNANWWFVFLNEYSLISGLLWFILYLFLFLLCGWSVTFFLWFPYFLKLSFAFCLSLLHSLVGCTPITAIKFSRRVLFVKLYILLLFTINLNISLLLFVAIHSHSFFIFIAWSFYRM